MDLVVQPWNTSILAVHRERKEKAKFKMHETKITTTATCKNIRGKYVENPKNTLQ